MEHRLGSVSQELNSWISGPLWEHQPPEAPSFLSKQKPNLPIYRLLPALTDRGVGSEDISPARWGAHSEPQQPLLFWRSGPWRLCPPTPAATSSFAAVLLCRHFLLLSDFICRHVSGSPHRLGCINDTLFSTLVVGFSSQVLYHLSIISTDLGIERWVHSVCSALLILSLVTNLKLLTDCWPWNGHLT